jgi:archaemetzincin
MRAFSRVLAVLLALLLVAPAGADVPAARYRVCLQPLGAHDARLLAPIGRGLAQVYGVQVRTLAARPLPKSAWYPPRSRYRAPKLLDHLRETVLRATPACDAVLGLTAVDVSTTKGEHADWGVLGLSYLGERVGVVSAFRMRRGVDAQQLAQRAVKVSIHEFGHGLGLPHRAGGPECIMNDAGGAVRVIDRAHGTLCAPERRAAQAALGFSLPRPAPLDWDAILR